MRTIQNKKAIFCFSCRAKVPSTAGQSTKDNCIKLNYSLFVVGIVGTVGDNDVIQELDAHDGAGLLDAHREIVVGTTGTEAS